MDTDLLITGLLVVPGFAMLISSLKSLVFKERVPPNVVGWFNNILFIIQVVLSVLLWMELDADKIIESTSISGLAVDWLSGTILLISNSVFLVAGLFSLYYIDKDRFGSYFTLYGSMQLGINLVLMANHFIFLFVFWEMMVVSGYVMVVFEQKDESYEAGFKYLIMSSMGSLFLLLGIALLSGILPGLGFDQVGTVNVLDTMIGKLATSFIIIGFGVTAGMVALNQWLADAHPAAPAPVSALLSGIIVKAGIYGVYRSLSVIIDPLSLNVSSSTIIVIIAAITMTEGNIMVIAQLQRDDIIDFKRILAYSTTVHLGYLLLVVGFTSELGNLALLMHTINHALAKGLLFMISGYLIHEYGTKDLRILKSKKIGLNDKLVAFPIIVALFSLGGLPLTGGFVSKLLVLFSVYEQIAITSGITSNIIFWVLIIAVINSAMAFGGYLWIIKILIFNQEEETEENIIETKGTWVKYLFVFLAVLILIFGIFPNLLINPLLSII